MSVNEQRDRTNPRCVVLRSERKDSVDVSLKADESGPGQDIPRSKADKSIRERTCRDRKSPVLARSESNTRRPVRLKLRKNVLGPSVLQSSEKVANPIHEKL